MELYPPGDSIQALVNVFQRYRHVRFPSLREQFDEEFNQRYEEFWEKQSGQMRLFSMLGKPVRPYPARLDFDLAVCQALEIPITKNDLVQLYEVLVNEMIIVRRLRRDWGNSRARSHSRGRVVIFKNMIENHQASVVVKNQINPWDLIFVNLFSYILSPYSEEIDEDATIRRRFDTSPVEWRRLSHPIIVYVPYGILSTSADSASHSILDRRSISYFGMATPSELAHCYPIVLLCSYIAISLRI